MRANFITHSKIPTLIEYKESGITCFPSQKYYRNARRRKIDIIFQAMLMDENTEAHDWINSS